MCDMVACGMEVGGVSGGGVDMVEQACVELFSRAQYLDHSGDRRFNKRPNTEMEQGESTNYKHSKKRRKLSQVDGLPLSAVDMPGCVAVGVHHGEHDEDPVATDLAQVGSQRTLGHILEHDRYTRCVPSRVVGWKDGSG